MRIPTFPFFVGSGIWAVASLYLAWIGLPYGALLALVVAVGLFIIWCILKQFKWLAGIDQRLKRLEERGLE